MKNLPFLAQRMFNTPLAIAPNKVEIVIAALADRFGITALFRANGERFALSEFAVDAADEAYDRPYEVVAGVAVIPILGTLVQKSGYLRPFSGMTGYDGIRANLSMALDDDSVRAILLDIDSNGGEVTGLFDLVDAMYNARGRKPIWAALSECAYSAAYAIASAADRITVPRTGGTGSVGVVCAHVDFSKALSKEGIAVTLIHYGARKVDGNEFNPLSNEALARFQAQVDEMGELFVATVARNRQLPTNAVRDTEAETFLGAAGVEIGFADAVMAPDEAFRALLAELD
ncbi:signal peptide peptidase SppA [Paraburkholderia sp. BL8N3]|nr:S49 family peptidase [Paraburkholderia sp. BL8N3]TCK36717.1 signal peptide peptidase SppA [Paraburkholderia sp. BL8N3]